MNTFKSIVVSMLCIWVVLTTIVTMPIEMDYKWQAWAIVAFGPVVLVVGLCEICRKVFIKGNR